MTTDQATHAIAHDEGRRRFSTVVDGVEGRVDYTREGDVLTITHTYVPTLIGGRGIAGALVKAALDYAREAGLRVNPRCSYADAWMRKHAGYGDLRA